MTPTMRSLWWRRAGTLWRRAPTPAGSARPLRQPGANLERDHRTRPIDACPGLCQLDPRGLIGAGHTAIHRLPIGLVALVLSVSGALARTGTTITDLGLRAGPSSNTDLLLTMPAGVKVYVRACSGPWCKVSWSGYSGYAVKSGLTIGGSSRPTRCRPRSLPAARRDRADLPTLSLSFGLLSQ